MAMNNKCTCLFSLPKLYRSNEQGSRPGKAFTDDKM